MTADPIVGIEIITLGREGSLTPGYLKSPTDIAQRKPSALGLQSRDQPVFWLSTL